VVLDKTCLEDNIAIAQDLYDSAVEGTKPGQYIVGSKATLKATLDAAIFSVKQYFSHPGRILQMPVRSLWQRSIPSMRNLIQEIAAANLIGFWKFNNNANDSSGKGNNGILTIGHSLLWWRLCHSYG
jgi:hypothetical protein